MAPKTEGFCVAANGSAPTLFVALPASDTASGTTPATQVEATVPLFAALSTFSPNEDTTRPKTVTRPFFIIGQQKSKSRIRRPSIGNRAARMSDKSSALNISHPVKKETAPQSPTSSKHVNVKAVVGTSGGIGIANNAPSSFPNPKSRASCSRNLFGTSSSAEVKSAEVKSGSKPAKRTNVDAENEHRDKSSQSVMFPSSLASSALHSPTRGFSFNPSTHKLGATSTLGKAHSIDFLARPASSPISRSNSNSSTSSFSFKPTAIGAFANERSINVSSFCFKPHAIVAIGNSTAVSHKPTSSAPNTNPKSVVSAFTFTPNTCGTFGAHSTGNADNKPISFANNEPKDSSLPFKPNGFGMLVESSTTNFCNNTTPFAKISSEGPTATLFQQTNAADKHLPPVFFCNTPNTFTKVNPNDSNASLLKNTNESRPALNFCKESNHCATADKKDSISPFSFKPNVCNSFGSSPTFNFVYNPTAVGHLSEDPNKIPVFSFNTRASTLNAGCLFGNATSIFSNKEDISHTGSGFSPKSKTVSQNATDIFNCPIPSTFNFGGNQKNYFSPYQGSSNTSSKPSRKILRQSSTGFLFSPSNAQTTNSFCSPTNNSMFNDAVASLSKPTQLSHPNETMLSDNFCSAIPNSGPEPTQSMQRFTFGNEKTQSLSLLPLPGPGANPVVVQIQNVATGSHQACGGELAVNSTRNPQSISISQTSSPKPCISINTNNNLVIQITSDSIQVIINPSTNS